MKVFYFTHQILLLQLLVNRIKDEVISIDFEIFIIWWWEMLVKWFGGDQG